jgi:inner membrane protein
MDPVTNGLASYALTRAAFPRASRVTLAGAVLAGTAADLDQLSAYAGPSAFLAWYRTFTHSVAAALVLAVIFTLAVALLRNQNKDSIKTILPLFLMASVLHLAMDLCQNESVELLWPFRSQRVSLDSVAHLDLWILLTLLAGALLPLLLGLVTEEIGAKSKAPRGRIGAALALLAVCAYIGARFVLHGNAVALLDSRTYRGELPRKVAAFAESDTPFHWHGIVETERALRDIDVDLARASSFNPDSSVVAYKPETSPALEAARNTEAARRFLQAARFPKASVETTTTGCRIELGDFRNRRAGQSGWRVLATIETDNNARVIHQELEWDPSSREVWWK